MLMGSTRVGPRTTVCTHLCRMSYQLLLLPLHVLHVRQRVEPEVMSLATCPTGPTQTSYVTVRGHISLSHSCSANEPPTNHYADVSTNNSSKLLARASETYSFTSNARRNTPSALSKCICKSALTFSHAFRCICSQWGQTAFVKEFDERVRKGGDKLVLVDFYAK
jgi:hypothetical protein